MDDETTGAGTAASPPVTPGTSRRLALKGALAAASGAIVAAVAMDATPASAAALVSNGTNTEPTGLTAFNYTGSAGGTAWLFQAGSGWAPGDAIRPSALGGWTTVPARPFGVYGHTSVTGTNGGAGVVGRSTAADSPGVVGENADGKGVYGTGSIGVHASGHIGVLSEGDSYALYAVAANGAALRLAPSTYNPPGTSRPAPSARTDFHNVGEIDVDIAGDLWYCAAEGTPGSWRKLAGVRSAGAFHALAPGRVYDSRLAVPGPATPLVTPSLRTVSVADRRDAATGAVALADFVAPGATAIAANITVTNTVGAGFLTANPGGLFGISAATINWYQSGQILNNGVILKLNANRELTVVIGGDTGSSAHFIIDVTGYYL